MLHFSFCVTFLLSLWITETFSADVSQKACGSHGPAILQSTRGDIYSPGYKEGKNYPEGANCTYIIRGLVGETIKLKFLDFDVEIADVCSADNLRLATGPRITDPTVKLFCGHQNPRDLLVPLNTITLIFTSDYMHSGRGFHIRYEIVQDQSVCESRKMFSCFNRNCVSQEDLCDDTDDCGDASDEVPPVCAGFPPMPTNYTCGLPQIKPDVSDLSPRIVGGKEVIPGSWPWQVDLQIRLPEPSGHICGGTLIHPEWVLTASHCLLQFNQKQILKVILGKHHKFEEDATEQTRYIEQYYAYPGLKDGEFQPSKHLNLVHDLTLLKLHAPIAITSHVIPACLPEDNEQLEPGTKCVVTGWGMTRGSGTSDRLKQLTLVVQKPDACMDVAHRFNNKTMICVKHLVHGNGVCNGDSGGPLVCQRKDGRWAVHGVASFVTDSNLLQPICGNIDNAVSYSKVSRKVEWITEVMRTGSAEGDSVDAIDE